MKRILVLTAPAGGGHTATANNIAAAIRQAYPDDYDVRVADVLADFDLAVPLEKLTTPAYSSSVAWFNSYPYKFFFKFASLSAGIINRFATTVLKEPALRYLRDYDPDIIISTFPIISYGASKLLADWHKKIPLISIVTDAGDVHRLWLLGGDDAILVATPDTMAYAVEKGVPIERVHYLGFPVDPRLSELPDREEARRKLGLEPGRMTILHLPLTPIASAKFLGASRKTLKLAKKLAPLELGFQHVFVAGRNEALFEGLEAITFADKAHVLGYTRDMPLLLAAADLVVGKAGWVSLYEAMVAQRPTFIFNIVPGQEEPNAQFVVSRGVGRVIEDVDGMFDELVRVAAQPERLQPYAEAFLEYRLDPNAGRRIAQFVHKRYGEGA